jgi:nitrogen fixation-related uncharacterized protein
MLDLTAVRPAVVLLATLVACLAAPFALRAQPANDAAYNAVVDEAVAEFSAGRWEEARTLFKRAHELSPNARTLRGMGMAGFEMRLYVQAIRELEAALRDTRKPLDVELRAQVQQLIVKARAFVGRVKPVVEPSQARLLVDGRDPVLEPDGTVLLDVGPHVISATLDGYKPSNVRLSVEGGAELVVRVPLEPLLSAAPVVPAIDPNRPAVQPGPAAEPPAAPAAPPEPRSGSHLDTFAWIALAGGAAFGATAAVFWFGVGDGQYDDLQDSCGARGCSEREIADSGVETSDALSTVFLSLALASGAASGVLFALHASSGTEGERDPVTVQALPGAVSVRGRF